MLWLFDAARLFDFRGDCLWCGDKWAWWMGMKLPWAFACSLMATCRAIPQWWLTDDAMRGEKKRALLPVCSMPRHHGQWWNFGVPFCGPHAMMRSYDSFILLHQMPAVWRRLINHCPRGRNDLPKWWSRKVISLIGRKFIPQGGHRRLRRFTCRQALYGMPNARRANTILSTPFLPLPNYWSIRRKAGLNKVNCAVVADGRLYIACRKQTEYIMLTK